MLLNSKPARKIRLLFLLAFILSPAPVNAKPEFELSTLLKSLVYLGISDAPTLNHNLILYQEILKTIVRDAKIAKRSLTRSQAKYPQYRILKSLYEIQHRLQSQVPYLPYDLASFTLGETWNSISDAIHATKNQDYDRVLKDSADAIAILENSNI